MTWWNKIYLTDIKIKEEKQPENENYVYKFDINRQSYGGNGSMAYKAHQIYTSNKTHTIFITLLCV